MNTEFLRLAYERTVVADCRRHLMEKYLEGGGGQKEVLICEEAQYGLREVPQEMFVEFIMRLEEEEKRITDQMAQFVMQKREARVPIAQRKKTPEEDGNQEPKPEDGSEVSSGKPRRAPRKSRGQQQGTG